MHKYDQLCPTLTIWRHTNWWKMLMRWFHQNWRRQRSQRHGLPFMWGGGEGWQRQYDLTGTLFSYRCMKTYSLNTKLDVKKRCQNYPHRCQSRRWSLETHMQRNGWRHRLPSTQPSQLDEFKERQNNFDLFCTAYIDLFCTAYITWYRTTVVYWLLLVSTPRGLGSYASLNVP